MKRLRGFVGLMIVAAAAHALLAAPDKEAVPNYYPHQPGTKWHYQVEAGGGNRQVTMQIAKIEKIDGQELARLEVVSAGSIGASEHISNTARGIYRHRINGIELMPALCLLRYPVKEGESWDTEVTMGKEKVKVTCRVGKEEQVEVPAGKFKAVKVQVDLDQAGQKVEFTYWFALGAGVVQQTGRIAGQDISLKLEKLELPK